MGDFPVGKRLSGRVLLRAAWFASMFGLFNVASADEGMWQPAQLPEIADQLRSSGLAIEPEELSDLTAHPMGAIVGLGFCSAAFVSPQGLVATNHHCAYGAIQYNSTGEKNLLDEGFLADSPSAELPGDPNLRVYVTEEMRVVTPEIEAAIPRGAKGKKRYDAIDATKKSLIAECESSGQHRCNVYTFFGGHEYQLIKQLEIRDVRLVYAPPQSIGKYGGDIDNWMWPRHTGDFTFLRAYVAPDGNPAPFSEDNIPYEPKHHLKVSDQGMSEGDFAMLAGYPGRTYRYRRAKEVDYAIQTIYPTRIDMYQSLLDIIAEETADRPDAAVKYASFVASLNNALKNSRGMLDNFAKDDAVARRSALESDFLRWIERDQTRSGKYLDSVEQLSQLLTEEQAEWESENLYDWMRRAASLLSSAATMYRLAHEKQKPDAERDSDFQERNWPRIQGRIKAQERRQDMQVEQALLAHLISQYAQLPVRQRVRAFDRHFDLNGSDPSTKQALEKIKQMYASTKLGDSEYRLSWLEKDVADFQQSDDPIIALAVALFESDQRRETEQEAQDADLEAARAAYMGGLLEYRTDQGEAIYDDANGSLRVTYGTVKGYSPKDAVWYEPVTTLAGQIEKYTGESPFDLPQSVLDAAERATQSRYADEATQTMPVNFLTTVDITGGNSGSATLNAKGEFVGLVFDRNYEGMSADWSFNPKVTRAIHVDVRYMLWVMRDIDQAHWLIEEMGL